MRDSIVAECAEQRAALRPGWRKRLMNPELRGHQPESTARSDAPRVHASSMA